MSSLPFSLTINETPGQPQPQILLHHPHLLVSNSHFTLQALCFFLIIREGTRFKVDLNPNEQLYFQFLKTDFRYNDQIIEKPVKKVLAD